MKKIYLKKEITNHKNLILVSILIIILTYIGINGFSNPLKYFVKQENVELEFIEKDNITYYELEGVNYIIIDEHLKKAKGNWVVKATYYDDKYKVLEKNTYITKKGYNCFKNNDNASFLSIDLEALNNVTLLGRDTKWIDMKSTSITVFGIIIIYLIQFGIFTLKRLFSK